MFNKEILQNFKNFVKKRKFVLKYKLIEVKEILLIIVS